MNIQGAVSLGSAVSGAISSVLSIGGAVSAGALVINDYVIRLESVEGGTKLIVSRGNEAQTAIIADGISPAIDVQTADGGYNLIITDANGTKTHFLPAMCSGESGANLPAVSETDNGKVLTVVNGEWAAAELPKYDGEYSVTPAIEEQTLLTAQKLMDVNLKIEKIPYSEVSNVANGTTATIG